MEETSVLIAIRSIPILVQIKKQEKQTHHVLRIILDIICHTYGEYHVITSDLLLLVVNPLSPAALEIPNHMQAYCGTTSPGHVRRVGVFEHQCIGGYTSYPVAHAALVTHDTILNVMGCDQYVWAM
jgi:hypothetical protein